MANKARGEVSLGDGTIKFTINAICEFETETGRKFIDVANELQAGSPSIAVLRDLIWAGMRSSRPDASKNDAGDLMECAGLKASGEALSEALRAAFPDAADPEAAEQKN